MKLSMLLTLFIIVLFFWGCTKENALFSYHDVPKETNDGIATNSLSSVGIDSSIFYDFIKKLPKDKEHKLSSFLVMKDNNLVFEKYWNGYNYSKPHDLRSATKSITSILVGIAIDKGFIKNEKEPISKYLGEYGKLLKDTTLTIQDFLNMDSGLDCDDWNMMSPGNEEKMYCQKDWIKFMVDLPKVTPKPNNAVYCTGGVVLLGYAVQLASRMRLDVFAQKYLFEPLAIKNYSWEYFDKKNKVDAGGHLCLSPRNLIKIGQLIINEGYYKNSQVVSKEWIVKSKKIVSKFKSNEDYGNLWWKKTYIENNLNYELVYALGNGGQLLITIPSEKIIAVFTGENYNNSNTLLPLEIVKKVILPSIK